ncbi:MAG: hypothetical protein LBU58_03355, partial [Clostridiales bacterium]|jgi:3-hydroxymyristoyl/3-hydroxydecanoyl-(acyl carrier protein) dehydratase|nr:hypothetical protein [Clostridiales bacterium]
MGFGFSLSAAASVVKHALQLYLNNVFVYLGDREDQRRWFDERDPCRWIVRGEKRASVVAGYTREKQLGFVAMTDCIDNTRTDKKILSRNVPIPVRFRDTDELGEKLTALIGKAAKTDLRQFYDDAWKGFHEGPGADNGQPERYTAVILCDSKESLRRELTEMLDHIPEFSGAGYHYESKKGSFCTMSPFGPDAKIAYMNPVGGMQHMPPFYDLLLMFPGHRNTSTAFFDSWFVKALTQIDDTFGAYTKEMCMVGIADRMASGSLGLRPDVLTGVSMGEMAALFSYDSMAVDLETARERTTFELMMALKDVYTYEEHEMKSIYLRGDFKEIEKLVNEEENAYIVLLTSPNGAFVTAWPEVMDRLIEKGGFIPMPMPKGITIHTPLVEKFIEPIYEAVLRCKTHIKPDLSYSIFSSYWKKDLGPTSEDLAEYISRVLTKPSDFWGSMEVMYERGARVFVDMSTAGSNFIFANEIFHDRETLNISIYPSAYEPRESMIRLGAKLLSNGIRFDTDVFLNTFEFTALTRPSFIQAVPMGIQGMLARFGAAENRLRLDNAAAAGDAGAASAPPPENVSAAAALRETDAAATAGAASFAGPAPAAGRASLHAFSPAAASAPAPAFAPVEASVSAPAPAPVSAPASTPAPAFAPVETSASAPAPAPVSTPASAPASPPAPPGFSALLAESLRNNFRAYMLYAENEAMLLRAAYAGNRRPAPVPAKRPIWDLPQIIEMTRGSMANVLGESYRALDGRSVRARMPLPPFLFVSRVTGLNAEFGQLKPSRIEMEYDIGGDCVLLMSKSTVSYVMLTESSHVAILLLAYIGIDLMAQDAQCYRILDTKVYYHNDFPIKGETIRGVLEFVDFKQNGRTTLVNSKYACYSGGDLVLSMDLTGGFFTAQDLDVLKGLVRPARRPQKPIPGIAAAVSDHPRNENPLRDLQGFYDGLYGPNLLPKRGAPKAERYYIVPKARMLDRVVSVEHNGGDYGMGKVTAEMKIDAGFWAFEAHFLNDPVFPASFLAEAANQIQVLFAINAGYVREDKNYLLSYLKDLPVKSSYRGQIRPVESLIRYEQHFKAIEESEGRLLLISDYEVFWQGVCVARIEDISLIFEEMDH